MCLTAGLGSPDPLAELRRGTKREGRDRKGEWTRKGGRGNRGSEVEA